MWDGAHMEKKRFHAMHVSRTRKLACVNWCVNGYAAMFLRAISLI